MTETVKGQIYLITNKLNGKQYVGQTVTHRCKLGKMVHFGYLNRFKEHCQSKANTLLAKALREDGVKNFTVELVTECIHSHTDDEEEKYILQYNTMNPNGYNMIFGSPHKGSIEFPRKSISENLKNYYDNDNVKRQHSVVHRNKQTKVDTNKISSIEVRPIKNNGENKIVYAYIRFNDGTSTRKRFGGLHETYEESLQRCLEQCKKLADADKIKVIDNKLDDRFNKRDVPENITAIDVRLHAVKSHEYVAVYVSFEEMTSWNEKKRYLFGGSSVELQHAYQQAIDFVNKIKPLNINFTVKDILVAKLPNCGKSLKP